MDDARTVTFSLGSMVFEYDEEKNRTNLRKHGISFRTAARVFFDYDRIEFYDEDNSSAEDRYDTIGDVSAGKAAAGQPIQSIGKVNDILFVVYTERMRLDENGHQMDVTRLISARMATNFERGVYYGKYE